MKHLATVNDITANRFAPNWNGLPVQSVKIVELIQVEVARGSGVKGDVSRIVTQYWSKEGKLVAEVDPAPPEIEV